MGRAPRRTREIRRGRRLAAAAALCALLLPAGLSAAPCDPFDPHSAARSALIRLAASDLVAPGSDVLRTFVETGSLGPTAATLVAASPPGIVRRVWAVPEISRLSRDYGEALRGVAVAVALKPGARPNRVVVRVRQVCARYFRNTFLYY